MNGAILALWLATSAPAAPATDAAAPLTPSKVEEAQDNLNRAQQIYSQSCDDRAFATYIDLCNGLADQIHQYQLDLDRLQREAAKRGKTTTPAPKS